MEAQYWETDGLHFAPRGSQVGRIDVEMVQLHVYPWPHEVSDGTTPSVLFLSEPSNLSGGRFGWEMGAEVLGQSLALVVAQLAHP